MRAATIFLLGVGLLAMGGDALERAGLGTAGRPLRAFGAASAASPAPKVFTSAGGLETFSTRFTLEWTDRSGAPQALRLTPRVVRRLRGPYHRRNVFGAALAYGPVLAADPRTAPLLDAVLRHALCGDAPLLRELGVDPAQVDGHARIRLAPRPGTDTRGMQLVLTPACARNGEPCR